MRCDPVQPCRGGIRFVALAGLFYATQQLSSVARGERGIMDVTIAGMLTGSVFGATSTFALWLPATLHASQNMRFAADTPWPV